MNLCEIIESRARLQPASAALAFCDGRRLSYADLLADANRLAAGLSGSGVRRGQVVALALEDSANFVRLTLALSRLGAISAPKGIAASQYLVHDGAAGGLAGQTILAVSDLRARGRDLAVPAMATMQAHEPWRIGTSSGTTGKPKGIVFTVGGIIAKLDLNAVPAPQAGDLLMLGMGAGLSFAAGFWVRALAFGATLGLPPAGLAGQAEGLRLLRATHLVTSPDAALRLLQELRQPDGSWADPPPDLKAVYLGGARIPARLHEALRVHLCGQLYNHYGASEVGVIAVSDTAMALQDPDCAGRIAPWVEAQVIDEKGTLLAPGGHGLLRVRAACMAVGYYGGAGQVAGVSPFRDGWFHTNDIATITDDGKLYLGGRQDDVINLGGMKIDPARIEAAVAQDPAVLECAALTVQGLMGHPVLVVAVVANGAIDEASLKQRCSETLGQRFIPRVIVQYPKLPRNEAGKVMLGVLRERIRFVPANAQRSPLPGPPQ